MTYAVKIPVMQDAQIVKKKEYIYEGEQYWDSQAGPICKDCFDDMDRRAILELCDEKLQEAKEEIEWMN